MYDKIPWQWTGRKPSQRVDLQGKTLDPVDCAGAMNTPWFLRQWRNWKVMVHLTWAVTVAAVLDEMAPLAGWCGFNEKFDTPQKSSAKYTPFIEESVSFGIMREEKKSVSLVGRIFGRFFVVLKRFNLMRAILDCRKLDDKCGRPPALRLATIAEIALALQRFGSRAWFLSMDFRHYFHEIKLPPAVHRLFTIGVADRIFTQVTLPMGFSWAPWISQCCTATVILRAFNDSGLIINPDELVGEAPPPMIFGRNKQGDIVAIAVLWYDNVLIVCQYPPIAEKVKRMLKHLCSKESSGVVLKGDIALTESKVSYLGVDWRLTGNKLRWAHDVASVVEWALLLREQIATSREIARLIGVVLWDWQVSGEISPAEVADILAVSRALSSACASDPEKWDCQAVITEDQRARVMQAFHRVLVESEAVFKGRPPPPPDMPLVFACSDASNKAGAGVVLRPIQQLVWGEPWTEQEEELHISERETIAAVNTVRRLLQTGIADQHIVFGTDNVAARWVLAHFFFPSSEALTLELMLLANELAARGCFLTML